MTPSGEPGRDYTFNITIKDSAGIAQDLTALDGYALIAYVDDRRIVCQWSKNTLTGYLPITEVDAAAGQIQVLLPAAKTKTLNEVVVYIEPVIQVVDTTYGKLQFGEKDGKQIELISITSSGKAVVGDLNP